MGSLMRPPVSDVHKPLPIGHENVDYPFTPALLSVLRISRDFLRFFWGYRRIYWPRSSRGAAS